MKKFLLFFIIAVCLCGCEKAPQNKPEVTPTRYICVDCIGKPVIHDCECEHEVCQCNFDVSGELLHKYEDDKEIVIFLVASVKTKYLDETDVYSIPDGYLTKGIEDDWEMGWRSTKIEDFPYEKGYEYIIYARREHYMVGDEGYYKYHHIETLWKTKIKSFNLPDDADQY